MFKRWILTAVSIVLIAIPMAGVMPAAAQDAGLNVLAPESARAAVEAWAGAFADAELALTFVESGAAVIARLNEADIVFYDDPATEIAADCALSRVYVPLPDLAARAVACDGDLSPDALAFLTFAVEPDGQQIAIDLGLLPAAVEIVDQGGETVTIPQPVRRIAAAYGVGTFYVYAVGAADRLVAAAYLAVRDETSQAIMTRIDPDFPTITGAVSVIGQSETNIEEMAALQPDLIMAAARTGWLDTALELGVPIMRFEGESPEALKAAMTMLGAALGPNAAYRAEQYNAYYDRVLADILAQTEAIEDRVSVYMSGTEALRVASGDMYQSMMIEAAGGVSVTADLTGYWNDVNLEQVAVWDPEVIFFVPYGGANAEAFTDSEEWAIIGAVQQGRVYRVPKLAGPWDAPIPDSILGIIWMAQTLYPDQVSLDCATETETFYNLFYDYAIPEDEIAMVCG